MSRTGEERRGDWRVNEKPGALFSWEEQYLFLLADLAQTFYKYADYVNLYRPFSVPIIIEVLAFNTKIKQSRYDAAIHEVITDHKSLRIILVRGSRISLSSRGSPRRTELRGRPNANTLF